MASKLPRLLRLLLPLRASCRQICFSLSPLQVKASRWLFWPARGGFISKQIDQEVGIFPAVTLFLCDVPSSHDNALEALPFVSLSFGHLRIRAAMAVKVVVIFFL